jgi:hypothetical protein
MVAGTLFSAGRFQPIFGFLSGSSLFENLGSPRFWGPKSVNMACKHKGDFWVPLHMLNDTRLARVRACKKGFLSLIMA